MFIFTFRVSLSKNAVQRTYKGTWNQFTDLYPGAWLVRPVEPVDEEE